MFLGKSGKWAAKVKSATFEIKPNVVISIVKLDIVLLQTKDVGLHIYFNAMYLFCLYNFDDTMLDSCATVSFHVYI